MKNQEKKPVNKLNIWYIFDAKDKVLGRLATRLATKLMGKDTALWTPNADPKISVVVINAGKVAVTGNKEKDKSYYNYSGYPGGLKITQLDKMRADKPEQIIMHAVKGMLPKNRLGHRFMSRLYVYSGADHPHEAQKPVEVKI